jgi:hypothetical protein
MLQELAEQIVPQHCPAVLVQTEVSRADLSGADYLTRDLSKFRISRSARLLPQFILLRQLRARRRHP